MLLTVQWAMSETKQYQDVYEVIYMSGFMMVKYEQGKTVTIDLSAVISFTLVE